MPHALSISPRTLGVLMTSTLLLACTKPEEPKKTEPAPTKVGATPDTPKPPTLPAVPPPVAPDQKIEVSGGAVLRALAAEPEILGHFAIADSSAMLAGIKTQLVTPRYAGFLEEAALRSFVSMALDKRSAIAQNFDLAAPLGCALVDPKPEDPKVACTFGYKGGAKAFLADLGETNKQQDAAGHFAAYSVDGKSAYVDALAGEHVVVSAGADTFTKSGAYLQRNVVDRAKEIAGDVEFVVYVASAYDRYRAAIDPLIEQFSNTGDIPVATGNPTVDGAVQAFMSYRKRSSKEGLQRFAEYAQISMFFGVEPAGVTIGAALFPRPGSRAAQDAALYGGTRLDPAFAGLAPAGTAMMFAMQMNPRTHEAQASADMRRMVAEVWAPVAGRDAAGIEAGIAEFQRQNAELFDGQSMFAVGHEPGAPAALTLAARLNPGKSSREAYKAWTAGFTPQAVLGPEFSRYVSWKFTPDAATIDGVPVDRLTLEPGPDVKSKLDKEMPPDAKAMVDKVLGGVFLHIDRAEAGGHVIYTLAPKAEAAYMQRVLAGFAGKGNVAGQAGLARALARDPQASGVFGVDVRAGLDWIRSFAAYGARVDSLPQLGADLGDFYATFRYGADGTTAMEYVMSQPLIDQIKGLIPG
jgi:hypothetical protein